LTDVVPVYDLRWVDDHRFLFTSKSGTSFELRLGSLGETSQLVATSEVALSFDFTD
jgi:hypothetical protein